MAIKAPDLTKQPPRSPRVQLGGYSLLPRMLDKGRAVLAGKNGEYHYNCPNDQQFTSFVGIDAGKLKKELAKDKGDWEILQWIKAHAKFKRTDAEIHVWSNWADQRGPNNPDARDYFNGEHRKLGKTRSDIVSWADYLDLDDYVSFGGNA
jgi:hypothetical protein